LTALSQKDSQLKSFNGTPEPPPGQARRVQPFLDLVLQFSDALRDAGIACHLAQVIDVCRSFEHIDIGRRDLVHAAMLAVLVCREEEIELFDAVFRTFWEGRERPVDNRSAGNADPVERTGSSLSEDGGSPSTRRIGMNEEGANGEHDSIADDCRLSYTHTAALVQRDIKTLTESEVEKARRLLRRMLRYLAMAPSRRYRAARKRSVRLDFRRTLRSAQRHDGIPVELRFHRRKRSRPRLLVLCDVSGSMQKYVDFFLELVFSMRAHLSRFEVGIFSTRLSMISHLFGRQSIADIMQRCTAAENDWGGGTDIGGCLKVFNDRHAPRILRTGSVAIILSDGWDCGDAETMRDEIARLRRSVRKLIWLNPLLGGADYQPLARGMRTALPHIDHFLAAHNLQSLVRVARILEFCP
jgi:uncharacterized protein with von Willebrand factor type A (vWA) domain